MLRDRATKGHTQSDTIYTHKNTHAERLLPRRRAIMYKTDRLQPPLAGTTSIAPFSEVPLAPGPSPDWAVASVAQRRGHVGSERRGRSKYYSWTSAPHEARSWNMPAHFEAYRDAGSRRWMHESCDSHPPPQPQSSSNSLTSSNSPSITGTCCSPERSAQPSEELVTESSRRSGNVGAGCCARAFRCTVAPSEPTVAAALADTARAAQRAMHRKVFPSIVAGCIGIVASGQAETLRGLRQVGASDAVTRRGRGELSEPNCL